MEATKRLLDGSSSDSEGDTTGVGETFAVGDYSLSSCPICLERFTLGNPAIIVSCRHGFHLQCLESWRQRSAKCPVCLKQLDERVDHIMLEGEAVRRLREAPRGERTDSAVPCEEEEPPRSLCGRIGLFLADLLSLTD
ncbi:hypothetical protein AGDE_13756 [Angomonas deanei]|uniref:RING-type E3 ubiquitin transferase n=1 Tax=Angomonas deanei TaxID=59799 RepID=A0A7G2CS32_9TRYP|nr:hypothetical protein AGDE_13756 [Angomonas deanei]CAD2221784.1 Ring finger domain/Zinc finger, C3HC4 type (RING finger)/RING-like zinc finger/RING-type zinc-finger containing protein, putative [Angomonas deanei]|eukprot:EPY21853.1 hypothetical protein AGDE_13756 [Angomonas deanei]